MIATVAMIFDLEKRSIVQLLTTLLREPAIRRGRSRHQALTGSPLERTSEIMPRATFTFTPSAISTSISAIVDHLRDLADDAAGGDDRVAAAHVLDHLLMRPSPASAAAG